MVTEAFLRRQDNGRYSPAEKQETAAETLTEWLDDGDPELTIKPASELNGIINDQNGGVAFAIADANVGDAVYYVIVWE